MMANYFRLFMAAVLFSPLGACSPEAQVRPAPNQAVVNQTEVDQHAQTIFRLYDLNQDGCISEDEYTRGAIATYEQLDKDSDHQLDAREIGGFDDDSRTADKNGDKSISLTEMLKLIEQRFKQGDLDHNQCLSRGEVDQMVRHELEKKNQSH
jgi:Ca2+-binding EF-hand superfamily protein